MKTLLTFLLVLTFGIGNAQNYNVSADTTTCRIVFTNPTTGDIAYNFAINKTKYVDRESGTILVFDDRSTFSGKASNISNYATIALLKTDLDTWFAACLGAGGGTITDGDGIYDGSGTVPTTTVATLTDNMLFDGGTAGEMSLGGNLVGLLSGAWGWLYGTGTPGDNNAYVITSDLTGIGYSDFTFQAGISPLGGAGPISLLSMEQDIATDVPYTSLVQSHSDAVNSVDLDIISQNLTGKSNMGVTSIGAGGSDPAIASLTAKSLTTLSYGIAQLICQNDVDGIKTRVQLSNNQVLIGDSDASTHWTMPTARGTDRELLKLDGSGAATWVPLGLEAMQDSCFALSLDGVQFDTICISSQGCTTIGLLVSSDTLFQLCDGAKVDTVILPGGGSGAFATAANVTSNSPGTLGTDDFVFGSDQLADDGDATHDNRVIFDKSLGAFHAGIVQGTQWDTRASGGAVLGGLNCTVTGTYAASVGGNAGTATGLGSFRGGGIITNATGPYAATIGGNDNDATLDNAATVGGTRNLARGKQSFVIGGNDCETAVNVSDCGIIGGDNNEILAGGARSVVQGQRNISANGDLFMCGKFAVSHASGGTTGSPLFQVGAGTAVGARADAITVLSTEETGFGYADFPNTGTGERVQINGELKVDGAIGNTMQTATGDGTTTVDWGLGNHFDFTFGAFNETFTFTAPTNPGIYTISLLQDGVGSRTATWPATVKWSGATAPTLTTTATTGYDIIGFRFDGTNYYEYTVVLDLR